MSQGFFTSPPVGMVVGIDPGITGAVAFVNSAGASWVHDMPVAMVKKGRREVMAAELSRILEAAPSATVYVERVNAMPKIGTKDGHNRSGQGVSSAFGFGRSVGVIEGVVAALRMPLVFVTPQAWKKHHGLSGADKDVSRTLASQLYPEAELSRKKDIGRADALLIARYGLDQLQARAA